MYFRLSAVALTGIALALSLTLPAAAATRHVAPGGHDAGGCVAHPCATLRHAYQVARPGDVVRVGRGIYGPRSCLGARRP